MLRGTAVGTLFGAHARHRARRSPPSSPTRSSARSSQDAGALRPRRARGRRRARGGVALEDAGRLHPDDVARHPGRRGDGADPGRADHQGHPARAAADHRAPGHLLGPDRELLDRQRAARDPQRADDRRVGAAAAGAVPLPVSRRRCSSSRRRLQHAATACSTSARSRPSASSARSSWRSTSRCRRSCSASCSGRCWRRTSGARCCCRAATWRCSCTRPISRRLHRRRARCWCWCSSWAASARPAAHGEVRAALSRRSGHVHGRHNAGTHHAGQPMPSLRTSPIALAATCALGGAGATTVRSGKPAASQPVAAAWPRASSCASASTPRPP